MSDNFEALCIKVYHGALCFLLKISLLNINKPALFCGFAHICNRFNSKFSFWPIFWLSLKNLNGKILNNNNHSSSELSVQENPGILIKFLNFSESSWIGKNTTTFNYHNQAKTKDTLMFHWPYCTQNLIKVRWCLEALQIFRISRLLTQES